MICIDSNKRIYGEIILIILFLTNILENIIIIKIVVLKLLFKLINNLFIIFILIKAHSK